MKYTLTQFSDYNNLRPAIELEDHDPLLPLEWVNRVYLEQVYNPEDWGEIRVKLFWEVENSVDPLNFDSVRITGYCPIKDPRFLSQTGKKAEVVKSDIAQMIAGGLMNKR